MNKNNNVSLTVEQLQRAALVTAEIETLSGEIQQLAAERTALELNFKAKSASLAEKQAEVSKILGRVVNRGRSKGFKVSDETRAKMREAHAKRLAVKSLKNTPVDATAGVTVNHSEVPSIEASVGTGE